jgi:hypothetical protein
MSDVKAEPVSFCLNGLSRYAFGDRWWFGVECEVQDSSISCVRTVLAVVTCVKRDRSFASLCI